MNKTRSSSLSPQRAWSILELVDVTAPSMGKSTRYRAEGSERKELLTMTRFHRSGVGFYRKWACLSISLLLLSSVSSVCDIEGDHSTFRGGSYCCWYDSILGCSYEQVNVGMVYTRPRSFTYSNKTSLRRGKNKYSECGTEDFLWTQYCILFVCEWKNEWESLEIEILQAHLSK